MSEKLIVKLEKDNTIRFPQEFVDERYLLEGDLFEVSIKGIDIVLTPTVIYPKEYVEELKEKIEKVNVKEVRPIEELLEKIESEFKKVKGLDYYISLPYEMKIIKDEGSYSVLFPELEGCFTSGETIEEAISNSYDAKENWFMAAFKDGIEIPEPNIRVLENDTEYINSIPGLAESIIEESNKPISEFIPEDEVDW